MNRNCGFSDRLSFLGCGFSRVLHRDSDNQTHQKTLCLYLCTEVSDTFLCQGQYWSSKLTFNNHSVLSLYPLNIAVQSCHIVLGNLPLSCRAVFPYHLSTFGEAGCLPRYLTAQFLHCFSLHHFWTHFFLAHRAASHWNDRQLVYKPAIPCFKVPEFIERKALSPAIEQHIYARQYRPPRKMGEQYL